MRKFMYLEALEVHAGFGYGSERQTFNQRCIGISDAFTFELQANVHLEAKYPRIVVSLYGPEALDAPTGVYFDGSKRLDLPRYAELRIVAARELFLESPIEFRSNLRTLIQSNLAEIAPRLESDELKIRKLIDDVLTRDEVFHIPIDALSLTSDPLKIKVQTFFRTTDDTSEIYAVVEHVNLPAKTPISLLKFDRPISLLGYLDTKLVIKEDKLILRSSNGKLVLAETVIPILSG